MAVQAVEASVTSISIPLTAVTYCRYSSTSPPFASQASTTTLSRSIRSSAFFLQDRNPFGQFRFSLLGLLRFCAGYLFLRRWLRGVVRFGGGYLSSLLLLGFLGLFLFMLYADLQVAHFLHLGFQQIAPGRGFGGQFAAQERFHQQSEVIERNLRIADGDRLGSFCGGFILGEQCWGEGKQ